MGFYKIQLQCFTICKKPLSWKGHQKHKSIYHRAQTSQQYQWLSSRNLSMINSISYLKAEEHLSVSLRAPCFEWRVIVNLQTRTSGEELQFAAALSPPGLTLSCEREAHGWRRTWWALHQKLLEWEQQVSHWNLIKLLLLLEKGLLVLSFWKEDESWTPWCLPPTDEDVLLSLLEPSLHFQRLHRKHRTKKVTREWGGPFPP